MAHEMCHLYQFEHGKPGSGRYHNAEFSDIMINIGLMPSSTGQPGGQRTGQKMGDYPISGGKFEALCQTLSVEGFFFPWIDLYPAIHSTTNTRLIA